MNKDLVSVIIPIYNAANTLDKTITSVLQQSYKYIELILVENGSTDSSIFISKKFAKLPNVQLINSNIKNASNARNIGLEKAKGDFILFLDADDFLDKNYIKEHIEAKLKHGNSSKIVTIGHFYYYSENEITEAYSISDATIQGRTSLIKKLFLSENDFMLQTSVFLLPKLFFKNYKWKTYLTLDDDGDFIFSVLSFYEDIVYLPEARFYYRKSISKKSLSKLRTKRALFSALKCQENKFRILEQITEIDHLTLLSNQFKIVNDFYQRDKTVGYMGLKYLLKMYGPEKVSNLISVKIKFFKNMKISIFLLDVLLRTNSYKNQIKRWRFL